MLRRRGRDGAKPRRAGSAGAAPFDDDLVRLLDPALRVVPFSGRDNELSELTTWAGGNDPVRVRLVTGPGGSGKSRLAHELGARLRRRRRRCVPLGPDDDPAQVAAACRSGRVLVVVDDADSFGRLAEQLGALIGAPARIRILLLARTGREWWTRLRWASDLWDGPEEVPTSVTHLHAPELEPDRMIEAAAHAFAERLGIVPPALVVGDVPADADPPRHGDVHAAVLAALAGAGSKAEPDAAGRSPVDIARGYAALLDIERDRWDDTDAVVARDLLRGHRTDLPARLAELHVARTLTAAPGMAEVCTAVLTPREAFHAALCAFRLDVDTPEVPGAGRLPAILLTHLASGLPDDAGMIARVLRLFPPQAFPAAQAADLAERLLGLTGGSDCRQDDTLRAEALGCSTRALELSGRLDEAVEPAQRAEEIWRRLADAEPRRYRIAHWRAQRDLATALMSVGRRREFTAIVERTVASWDAVPEAERVWTAPEHAWGLFALVVSTGRPGSADATRWFHERAVALLRDLVDTDPAAHEEMLALVQANMSVLVNQGRADEALDSLRESVAIRRRLARDRPDALERPLAQSLSNLSHALAAVGESAEALAAAQEALALRRRAVRKAAVAGQVAAVGLRFELAWSLSGVGVLLSEQGRPHDALSLEEEALSIRRDLAAETPQQYREMLATSCSNLGVTYSRLGRFGDALSLEEEATGIRRDLAATSFGYHRLHLARSLSNLGVRHSDMGRTEDAVAPTAEAVTLLRTLVRQDRRQNLPDLASALANLGATYADLARGQDAVPPLQEAVGILRDLARTHPTKYRPGLASALTALAVAFGEQRRSASAVAAAREAVRIRDRLAGADPRRFGDDLARSVRVLADLEEMLPADALRTSGADTLR